MRKVMPKSKRLMACVLAFALLGGCAKTPPPFLEEYTSIDLLIENGQVLDGLGSVLRPGF
jgi:hypothetical protein